MHITCCCTYEYDIFNIFECLYLYVSYDRYSCFLFCLQDRTTPTTALGVALTAVSLLSMYSSSSTVLDCGVVRTASDLYLLHPSIMHDDDGMPDLGFPLATHMQHMHGRVIYLVLRTWYYAAPRIQQYDSERHLTSLFECLRGEIVFTRTFFHVLSASPCWAGAGVRVILYKIKLPRSRMG